MKEILLVVANKEKTDIYLANHYSDEILKLDTIRNIKMKKQEQDFSSDKPGRVVRSFGFGSRKLIKEKKALLHSLEIYSFKISKKIKYFLKEYHGINIMLIAESGFLGSLKKHLVSQRIPLFSSLPKEMRFKNEKELITNLKNELLLL